MKKRKKWFLLGLVLISVLSTCYIGKYDVQAADFISRADSNTYLDAAYNFTISKSSNVSYFGCDNGYLANVTNDGQKGTIGAWFYNVGTYKGKSVDLKMTVVDWEYRKNGSILNVHPTLNNGIQIVNIDGATVRYDFYESGTSNLISVKGYACITDIDDQQGVTFLSGVEKVYLTTDTILSASGNRVSSPSVLTNNDETRAWAQLVFNTNSFTVKYHNSPDMYSHFDFAPNAITSLAKIAHKVTTSNENGVITDNITDIKDGENRTITWTPNPGYYVKSVSIDGTLQNSVNEAGDSYTFNNIVGNHTVDVVCVPYCKVETEVINGIITDSNLTLKAGESYGVQYSPNPGYYLKSVTVDGNSVDITAFEKKYDFTNITGNHHIKVIYEPTPVIKITKQISYDDIYWEFGNPSFIFKIEGTDYLGKKHIYYRTISFNIEDTVSEGVLSKTIEEQNIPAGEYSVTECQVSRYNLSKVTDLVGSKIISDGALYDTMNNNQASATFVNDHTRYDKFSHKDVVINRIGNLLD